VLSDRGLCVGLIRAVPASVVYLSVTLKPRQWGVPGPLGAFEAWGEKKLVITFNVTGHEYEICNGTGKIGGFVMEMTIHFGL
jgi:hypothetical protein